MEIKYEKINQLDEAYKQISLLLTPEICDLINLDADGISSPINNDETATMLYKISEEIRIYFSDDFIDIELYDEIALNVANIESEHQLSRYLKLIRTKVDVIFEMVQSMTDYENFKVKYWGDIFMDGIKSQGFLHPDKKAINNPITDLRASYLRIIEQLLVTRDNIDEQLSPGKVITSLPSSEWAPLEDPYKEWRLVIADPNRRLVYDKWTGKMRDTRQTIEANYDVIKTINSTGYKIESGNKDYDKFIGWANTITEKILPDHVFSYEIMNEIDLNLLELKTQREKDKYLEKLASELNSSSFSFKKYLKTHPEYREREVNWTTDEGGELIEMEIQKAVQVDNWRELHREKEKYTLQSFYIHLLVISEVLDRIVLYANELRSPEQPIVLQHELDLANHRLLLFHRLGLFKPLFTKYFNALGVGKFAKLLRTVLGIDDNEIRPDTFRKAVENFIKEVDNITVSKPTITITASDKVDAYLIEIGLRDLINNEKE